MLSRPCLWRRCQSGLQLVARRWSLCPRRRVRRHVRNASIRMMRQLFTCLYKCVCVYFCAASLCALRRAGLFVRASTPACSACKCVQVCAAELEKGTIHYAACRHACTQTYTHPHKHTRTLMVCTGSGSMWHVCSSGAWPRGLQRSRARGVRVAGNNNGGGEGHNSTSVMTGTAKRHPKYVGGTLERNGCRSRWWRRSKKERCDVRSRPP